MAEREPDAFDQMEADVRARIVRIPFHLRNGMLEHVLYGRPTGGFLTAFLSNDLMEALGKADENSLAGFTELRDFLYGAAPAQCYGSPAKVTAWREGGGLMGHALRHREGQEAGGG